MMVFYTDGVTEVFDEKGEEYGLDRLVRLVKENRNHAAAEIEDIIYKTVTEFASHSHIFDDLTMIILKRMMPKA
jgi:sigma-B regulation protein RsbU (phosphoserine phosphatase)